MVHGWGIWEGEVEGGRFLAPLQGATEVRFGAQGGARDSLALGFVVLAFQTRGSAGRLETKTVRHGSCFNKLPGWSGRLEIFRR